MELVAFDLGGSVVRVKAKNQVYKFVSDYMNINNTQNIPVGDISEFDDFEVLHCPNIEIQTKRYVKRDAFDYYRGTVVRCDNNDFKTKQSSTYINFIDAMNQIVIDSKESIRLGFCIPITEYKSESAEDFKRNIAGKYRICLKRSNRIIEYSIDKDDIIVAPEGIIAATPYYSKDKNIIIVDAGSRSLNIATTRGKHTNLVSANSPLKGGITLESIIVGELENTYGYYGELGDCLSTGKVKQNGKTINIQNIVYQAKQTLAYDIKNEISKVLSQQKVNLQVFTHIIFIGRCFMKSDTTGNLGKMVLNLLGDKLKKIEVSDLELANVEGMYTALERKSNENSL